MPNERLQIQRFELMSNLGKSALFPEVTSGRLLDILSEFHPRRVYLDYTGKGSFDDKGDLTLTLVYDTVPVLIRNEMRSFNIGISHCRSSEGGLHGSIVLDIIDNQFRDGAIKVTSSFGFIGDSTLIEINSLFKANLTPISDLSPSLIELLPNDVADWVLSILGYEGNRNRGLIYADPHLKKIINNMISRLYNSNMLRLRSRDITEVKSYYHKQLSQILDYNRDDDNIGPDMIESVLAESFGLESFDREGIRDKLFNEELPQTMQNLLIGLPTIKAKLDIEGESIRMYTGEVMTFHDFQQAIISMIPSIIELLGKGKIINKETTLEELENYLGINLIVVLQDGTKFGIFFSRSTEWCDKHQPKLN